METIDVIKKALKDNGVVDEDRPSFFGGQEKKVEKTYTLDEVRKAVKASGFGAAVVFKVLQNLR